MTSNQNTEKINPSRERKDLEIADYSLNLDALRAALGIVVLDSPAESSNSWPPEQELYSQQKVVDALGELKEYDDGLNQLGESSTILYPGSNCDEALAKVFGEQVIHVDPDEYAMDAMEKAEHKAVKSTIEDYVKNMPEKDSVDLVFSYNAGLVPPELLEKIRAGGYVIANNWHDSANDLGEKSEFKVVCAIDPQDGEIVGSEKAREALGVVETEFGEVAKYPDVLWLFKKSPNESAPEA